MMDYKSFEDVNALEVKSSGDAWHPKNILALSCPQGCHHLSERHSTRVVMSSTSREVMVDA